MTHKEGPRFYTDSKGETRDEVLPRLYSAFEDIKNNASREAEFGSEGFWEAVAERLQTWDKDDLFKVTQMISPEDLENMWGDQTKTLRCIIGEAYHKK